MNSLAPKNQYPWLAPSRGDCVSDWDHSDLIESCEGIWAFSCASIRRCRLDASFLSESDFRPGLCFVKYSNCFFWCSYVSRWCSGSGSALGRFKAAWRTAGISPTLPPDLLTWNTQTKLDTGSKKVSNFNAHKYEIATYISEEVHGNGCLCCLFLFLCLCWFPPRNTPTDGILHGPVEVSRDG